MYYYIDSNGQQQGPVAANDLPRNGVTPQTPVWRQGMSGWQQAGTVAELSAVFAPQQPTYAPQQPIYAPQQPIYALQQPTYAPQQPTYAPQQPKNGFEWFVKAVKQYVDFSGRARRKEYWYFTLFYLIFGIVTCYIGFLALLLPSLAVGVRRLHDIGKSGWFLLLALIPIVGSIILIVWLCEDSQPGVNEWGVNPKGF